MIVYKDLISGDEMMTDAFPQHPVVCDGETIEGMFEVRVSRRFCTEVLAHLVDSDSGAWYESCVNQAYLINLVTLHACRRSFLMKGLNLRQACRLRVYISSISTDGARDTTAVGAGARGLGVLEARHQEVCLLSPVSLPSSRLCGMASLCLARRVDTSGTCVYVPVCG